MFVALENTTVLEQKRELEAELETSLAYYDGSLDGADIVRAMGAPSTPASATASASVPDEGVPSKSSGDNSTGGKGSGASSSTRKHRLGRGAKVPRHRRSGSGSRGRGATAARAAKEPTPSRSSKPSVGEEVC